MHLLAALFAFGLTSTGRCFDANAHHQNTDNLLGARLRNELFSQDPQFGHCVAARPVVMMSNRGRAEDYDNIFRQDFFSINDIASNFSDPMITEPGWLNLTITDIPHLLNFSAPYPCYQGHFISYTAAKCHREKSKSGRSHVFWNGSNGYDLRIVGHNRWSVLWGPVRDHRNGVYTTSIRVTDPGSYQVEVRQNSQNGCHLADCDNPFCETVFKHRNREHFCKSPTQPCVHLVLNRSLIILPFTKASSFHDYPTMLPECSFSSIGTASGRWVKPMEPTERIGSNSQELFGESTWPLVWQPYDCSISWMTQEAMKECNNDKEIVYIGMSRERTNFFDVLDLQGKLVEYKKIDSQAQTENLHYFSIVYAQLKDMKGWNMADDKLINIKKSIQTELGDLPICSSNYTGSTGRDVHVFLTIDSIYIIESAVEERWEAILLTYFDAVQAACPRAVLHYSTTVALASQYGTLSWQRMYKISRMGIKIAESRNLSVVDAFSMTQPLTPDPDIFPDTLHLYTDTKLVGNYVSKTVTMLQMRQACPNL
jgi:hypothetical protein